LEDAVTGGRPGAIEWRHGNSCNGGACVEVAPLEDMIAVRDRANADGAILTFSGSSWRDFVADVKADKLGTVG
jgi:hypothetical protein